MTTDTIPTLAHAVRIGSDLSLYRERERAERVISHAAGGVLVELVDRRDYERERQRRIAAELALRNASDDASRQYHAMRDRHQKHADELVLKNMQGARALKALAEVNRLLGSDDRATELRGIIDAVLEGDRLPVYAELKRVTAERDELAARLEATAAPVLEVRACGCSQAKAGRCVMGDYGALPIGTQLYAGAAPERAEPVAAELARMWLVSHYSDGVEAEEIEEKCWEVLGFRDRAIELHDQLRMPMSEAISLAADEAAGTRSAAAPVQAQPCRTCGPDGCPDSVACPKGGAA